MNTGARYILAAVLNLIMVHATAQSLPQEVIDITNAAEKAYLANDIAELERCLLELECQNSLGLSKLEALALEAHHEKLLGNLDYCKSDYDSSCSVSALTHYKKAEYILFDKKVDAAVWGPTIQLEIAQLLYKQRNYVDALQYLDKASYSIKEAIAPYALCLAQVASTEEEFKESIELIEDEIKSSSGEDYWENIRKKAKILTLKAESGLGSMEESRRLYREYFEHQKKYVSDLFSSMTEAEREAYWMRQRQFVVDCYTLEDEDPALLYDVVLFSKSLLLRYSSRYQNFDDISWKDVQSSLPKKGCAIEFIQYRKDNSVKLGALVIRKKDKNPVFVPIGDVEDFGRTTVGKVGSRDITVNSAISSNSQRQIEKLYRNSIVRDFFWNDAMMAAIKKCSEIYFSPDGIAHQISLEYLCPNDGLRLHRLSSTRNVAQTKHRKDTGSALLIGDLEYNAMAHQKRGFENDILAYAALDKALKVDRTEMREVYAIGRIRDDTRDVTLSGESADELSFVENLEGKSMVYISSHGYLSGDMEASSNDLKPCTKDESLSRNVILLSDCMTNLKSTLFNPADGSDGFLSAREISRLDMSDINLCCLALCQGGVGQVTADGVYGIQRGLKNAGVGAMVISLWSVNGKATDKLMREFYNNIRKGESYQDAFTHARVSLIKENASPYYTDAFILVD